MSDAQPERRSRDGTPPTIVMQSYTDMTVGEKRQLRRLGFGMVVFGVGMPMGIEPFVSLHWVYWLFAGLVAVVGLMLLWPAAGFVVLDRLVAAAAKILPALRDVVRPERRDDE